MMAHSWARPVAAYPVAMPEDRIPESTAGTRELAASLLARLRPHRRDLAVVLVITMVGSALALAQPALVQQVIGTIGEDRPVGRLVTLLVAVVLAGAALSAVTSYLLPRVGLDVVMRTRQQLTDHLLQLPVAVLDAQRLGDVLSRVGSDTTLLQAAVTGGVIQIVNSVVVGVGALVAMALVDPPLLLVVVVLVAVAVVVIGVATVRVRTLTRIEQQHIGDISASAERALAAIRTIKAARAEAREAAVLAHAARQARDAGVRATRVRALISPIASLATQGAFLAVLGLGGARVASGALTVGELVAFVLYLFLLILPVAQAAQAISQLQQGLAALERIEQLQQLPREDADEDAHRTAEGQPQQTAGARWEGSGPAPRLEVRRVSFAHGDVGVLHDVSFRVPVGSRTALVGPSGAGKTTLLSLVERFADPDDGALLLDGVDLRDLPRQALRSRMGYVEQDAPALAGSLRDNLLLSRPDADDATLHAALTAVRLDTLVRRTPAGLDTQVGEHGVTLSGGERQRLAIARVLVARPDVLLLDEPTASLDARNEQAMTAAIDAVSVDRTVVIVAHRLSTVAACDQIVVLDEGRVVAVGTHEELVAADGLYRELAASQLLT